MKNLCSTTTLVTIMSYGASATSSSSASSALSPLSSSNKKSEFSSLSPVFLVLRGGNDDEQDTTGSPKEVKNPINDDDSEEKTATENKARHSSKSKKDKSTTNKKKKRQRRETKNKEDDDDDKNNSSSSSTKNEKRKPDIVESEILQCQEDDYYGILGVGKTASQTDIQKAYRRRAVKVHPDKTGGDRRAFDKVAESYDVLGDENKRQIFDRYGKRGLDNNGDLGGGGGGSAYQDFFRNAFSRRSSGTTNYTMRYQLQVTLEDLYNGITQDVVVTSPTNHQQQQYRNSNSKNVQVTIPKGSIEGQSIVLPGEMDFSNNDTPGDIVFVVSQAPHPIFTRKGHDLAMEMTISLEEAICGLHRRIRHLDGSSLWIKSAIISSNEDTKETKSDDSSNNNNNNDDDGDNEIPVVIQTGDVSTKYINIIYIYSCQQWLTLGGPFFFFTTGSSSQRTGNAQEA